MQYEREIFVFGSNLSGRHGKGAALLARQRYGAIYGQGEGLQGNSYAIPTKSLSQYPDGHLSTLPLSVIEFHVNKFCTFVEEHPQYRFILTAIGCGLAGYSPLQIAPMFRKLWDKPVNNVMFPQEFYNLWVTGVVE